MTSLALVVARNPTATRSAESYLPGPADLTWTNAGVSVALAGLDTSLAVEPGLVVAVSGRVPSSRHPGTTAEDAARRFLIAWRKEGAEAFRGLADDVLVIVALPESGIAHVFRDLGGAIPVYLLSDGGTFVATTSLPALVRSRWTLTVDERWVRSYLRGAWPPAAVSPYEEVVCLPPGHAAVTTPATWTHGRCDAHAFVQEHPPDVKTAADVFRSLFDRAVRRRISSVSGPVGVSLSGGLDSSSVLVTARAVAPDAELIALALAFEDPLGDERAYQEAAAQAARARLVWVDPRAQPGPFGRAPEHLFARFGSPSLAGNWFLHDGLATAAVDAGVERVLDGEDGDGVVGLQPAYLADMLAGGPALFLREFKALRTVRNLSLRRSCRQTLRAVVGAVRSGTWGQAHVAASQGLVQGGYLSALTSETHAQWEGLPGGQAHPFLDRRLLEYALPLPAGHKVHQGVGKMVLRRALSDRLPISILERTDKSRLSDPFVVSLRGPQFDVLQDGLATARRMSPDIRQVPVVDRATVRPEELYAAYRAAVVALWRVWLTQRHSDRDARDQLH